MSGRASTTAPAKDLDALIGLPPSTPPGNEWSIELLRGVAALLVVSTHYRGFFPGAPALFEFAFVGVDLFFVLSGWVFAPYLFGKPLAALAFFVRRLFRLYPLYLVALALYAGLHLANGRPLEHLLAHLLFLHTMQSQEVAFHFNPAFWSLPPEVEFYLALPVLAVLVRGLRPFLALLGISITLHLVLAYLRPVDPSQFPPVALMGVHLPGLLCEFLIGSIAWYFGRAGLHPASRGAALLLGFAVLAGLGLNFLALYAVGGDALVNTVALLRGNIGLFAAVGFSLVVAGLVGWLVRVPSVIQTASFVAGNLSYGVYLFHNAAPVLLDGLKRLVPSSVFGLACFLLTIALAALLHVVWEAPFRRFGRKLSARFIPRRAASA